jgi:hypothetical protein
LKVEVIESENAERPAVRRIAWLDDFTWLLKRHRITIYDVIAGVEHAVTISLKDALELDVALAKNLAAPVQTLCTDWQSADGSEKLAEYRIVP